MILHPDDARAMSRRRTDAGGGTTELKPVGSIVMLDGSSAPEDNIDSRKHQFELGPGELPGSFGEVRLVQRHKLGDVGD